MNGTSQSFTHFRVKVQACFAERAHRTDVNVASLQRQTLVKLISCCLKVFLSFLFCIKDPQCVA